MICTKRDSAILEKLGRFGILSTAQIGRIFFPSVDLTTVRKRLRILEQEKFIFRVQGLDDGGVGWALTQQSATQLGSQHPIRHFNRSSLKHDILLNEVRLSLETIGLGANWVPEHVLKRQKLAKSGFNREEITVPDAIFSVTCGNQPRIIALELELNGKNTKRYERILSRYQRMKHLWGVWYLVQNKSLGKTLETVWQQLNRGKRNDLLFWSLLEDVLKSPAEACAYSGHFKLRLKEMISISPALPTTPPESKQTMSAAASQITIVS